MEDKNVERYKVIKKDVEPISYQRWKEGVTSRFPSLFEATEIAASVLTQILITDITNPFALVLVDVPSSGKTTVLNFFKNIPELVYSTDKFTTASFVSSAANIKTEKLSKIDLLPRIRYMMFVIKDLASLFTKRTEDLKEVLGVLTRVLDGEGFKVESGSHGSRGYDGDYLFMMLAATTPIQNDVWNVMGSLGARLFFLKINSQEKEEQELSSQLVSKAYGGKVKEVNELTRSYMYTLWQKNKGGIHWDVNKDDKSLRIIIPRCALLLSRLRGAIQINSEKIWGGKDINNITSTVELPDRINQILYNLARGHAVVCDRNYITIEDLQAVIKVTLDSAPEIRVKIFNLLINSENGLTTRDLELKLMIGKDKALLEMKKLKALKIVDLNNTGTGTVGNKEYSISINSDLEWFCTDDFKFVKGDIKLSPQYSLGKLPV